MYIFVVLWMADDGCVVAEAVLLLRLPLLAAQAAVCASAQ